MGVVLCNQKKLGHSNTYNLLPKGNKSLEYQEDIKR